MREVSLQSQSSARQFIGGALVALVLSGFLSLAAIYCLNRYLGPIDDPPQTTGSLVPFPLTRRRNPVPQRDNVTAIGLG